MKFLHVADLHLGKSINGLSMIDSKDQVVWTERFLKLVSEAAPDAVVIAGDVYDRSNPSGDAMELLDHMLTELNAMQVPVLMIAGNHDSGQRISFAGELLTKNRIYVSGVAGKKLVHVTIPEKDGSGEVTFWLLPYVFPALVSQILEDDSLRDYDGAVRALLAAQDIDFSKRNVLIAHQNVTAWGREVERGGSESMVGGVGQIDFTAFDGFDYVALGHIHSSYPVGRDAVRYAGTPLCYHFDELRQPNKGPVLVTIGEKNGEYADVTTQVLEIEPLHPMRLIKGSYDQVRAEEEQCSRKDEYLRIEITDRRITPEYMDYFRSLAESRGSKVLEMVSSYEEQMGTEGIKHSMQDVSSMALNELFRDFFASRRGKEVSEEEGRALGYAEELAERDASSLRKDGTSEHFDDAVRELLDYVKKESKGGKA